MQPVSKTLRSLPPADWMNIRLPIWSQFGAPIDAFGVGTKLAVSADAPEVDMAYKLVEYAGKGGSSFRAAKRPIPGANRSSASSAIHVWLAILKGVIQPQPSLEESRRYLRQQVAQLPEARLGFEESAAPYPVQFSESLRADLENPRNPLVHGTHLL